MKKEYIIILTFLLLGIGFTIKSEHIISSSVEAKSNVSSEQVELDKLEVALDVGSNMRDCPLKTCSLIKYYDSGSLLYLVDVDESSLWYKAESVLNDKQSGWVHSSLFKKDYREEIELNKLNNVAALELRSLLEDNIDNQENLYNLKDYIVLLMISLLVFLLLRYTDKVNKNNIRLSIFTKVKQTLLIDRKNNTYLKKSLPFLLLIGVIILGCIFYYVSFREFNEKLTIVEEEKNEALLLASQKEKIARKEKSGRIEAQIIAKSESVKRIEEEVARRSAEQKTIYLEEEREEMEEDKDGDGLSLFVENKLGTSDNNRDTDNDGIDDSEDVHPTGGDRYIAQIFSWDYFYSNKKWDYQISVKDDWYSYYKNKPRVSHGTTYVTSDDKYIKEIASEIKSTAIENGYHTTTFALNFIQGLPYVGDYNTGYNEYPKYPIETLIEKNGDCEDTTYLASSILQSMNISTALITIPGEHMALGVWMKCSEDGTYYKAGNKCFYYFETTAKDWELGKIPPEYKNSKAEITDVSTGMKYTAYPTENVQCEESTEFHGYFYRNGTYYDDKKCVHSASCLGYNTTGVMYYYDVNKEQHFWDSSCLLKVTPGCTKSAQYSGYYYNKYYWYTDSQCINRATDI